MPHHMDLKMMKKSWQKINDMISAEHPDLLITCFGCPKQEKMDI